MEENFGLHIYIYIFIYFKKCPGSTVLNLTWPEHVQKACVCASICYYPHKAHTLFHICICLDIPPPEMLGCAHAHSILCVTKTSVHTLCLKPPDFRARMN